ncbi:FeoA family protein [Halodesulfovibrio aestuarii]|uniref:Ferrous iron transport protein A n=1 Tax=Halodesulfovibrio aestuarii TaxID=126333 RepID=A0A8G2F8J6_9BACT|nr:FeoA family protein [Halodesulfovibrio aestuarii]SHJ44548.1 ferrous iron transport protein A [Halodesulfovibrio aestuarii]
MPCCKRKHKLNSLPAGCKARIRGFCSEPKLRGRLCALGLTPGTVVEVCSPCSFRVKDCLLTLGDDIARKLECEPLENEQNLKSTETAGTL